MTQSNVKAMACKGPFSVYSWPVHDQVQDIEKDEQVAEDAPPVVVEDAILLTDLELLQVIKVSISRVYHKRLWPQHCQQNCYEQLPNIL